MTTNAPATRSYLELVERQSVAVRGIRHAAVFEPDHYCGWCEPANLGSVNRALSNLCQAGAHDRCPGQSVKRSGAAPWHCYCLCHYAPGHGRRLRARVS